MGETEANTIQFHQFKKGDDRAFSFFFKKYYDSIVGFCKQFIGDEDKAKSVAQEAFIKLWMNREKVQKASGIKAFLYRSAKTDCLNLLRHKEVVVKYKNVELQKKESQLNLEILNSLNFDKMSVSELERQIEKTIEELPEKCKEVFIKSRKENKKNKEISAELEISVKAVEAHITRALKILKTKLSNYLPAVLIEIILSGL